MQRRMRVLNGTVIAVNFFCLLLLMPAVANAQVFCVFDPLGSAGDYFNLFKDYQLAAQRWGVTVELKPYADDQALHDDFKAGKCDMASMIGFRAREFNGFTGTLDAPGVLDNYAEVRQAMAVIASPKLKSALSDGTYEVVGVLPIGAAYGVTRDRTKNSLKDAVGMRVPVLSWDKVGKMLVEDLKAQPVPLEMTHFGDAFNTGKVDVIVVPLVLFKALELEKGVGTQGGIMRRPFAQFTMQMVAYTSRFPTSFGQQSRDYMLTQTDHALSIAHNQEAGIDQRLWVYVMKHDVDLYDQTLRSILDHLAHEGLADRHMLAILKRIRCNSRTSESDCDSVSH